MFIDLPSNVLGSFLMGFVSSTAHLPKYLTEDLLVIGFRTGFLGSFTSFASWIFQVVTNMFTPSPHLGRQAHTLKTAWPEALMALFLGVALPLSAYTAGIHLASLIEERQLEASRRSPLKRQDTDLGSEEFGDAADDALLKRETKRQRRVVFLVFTIAVALQIGLFIGLAVGDGRRSRVRQAYWISCLLGLIGAPLRFTLGAMLNSKHAYMHYGTLAANVLGCLIDFITFAVIRGGRFSDRRHAELWGTAIRLGLAGSLSTVSTWVHEIQLLAKAIPGNFHAYRYAAASMFISVASGMVIYGWALRER